MGHVNPSSHSLTVPFQVESASSVSHDLNSIITNKTQTLAFSISNSSFIYEIIARNYSCRYFLPTGYKKISE